MKTISEIKKDLSESTYDAKLEQMYCRKGAALDIYKARLLKVTEGLQSQFGLGDDAQAALFSAPGRTEMGGNHTDHQRGKVLTGSVDLDAVACAAPNGTSVINIYSEGYGLTSVDISDLAINEKEFNTTASLIRGVAAGITAKGYQVGGFDAWMVSSVPGGSGLSSSACVEVLYGTILSNLFCGGALSMPEIAKIGQFAENKYFGKPSGLMDQMGCAIGGVVAIDFFDLSDPKIETVEYDIAKAGYAMCIVDSGADHADLTNDYASMPIEMRSVAACLGKEVLSEVDEAEFYENLPIIREKVGDRAILRAIHYYSDCRRVSAEIKALIDDDFDAYLKLVNESGTSSFKYLQNISTFRDPADQPVAVTLAAAEHLLNGKGASRVHGGGLAGAIQVYVPLSEVESFKESIEKMLGKDCCKQVFIRAIGGCMVSE